ncbi:hypothetical protein EsH8_II_000461 [Colletotrichum jinshuiense]
MLSDKPLKEQLEAAMCQSISLNGDEPKWFLPNNELDRLVTSDSALRAMRQSASLSPGFMCSIYASTIFSGSDKYLKVFATLVLIDKTELLHKFMRNSISDKHLPLALSSESGAETTLVRSLTTPFCFDLSLAGLDHQDAVKFEEVQWKLLAPSFKQVDMDGEPYGFPEKTILPFVSSTPTNAGQPFSQSGGFSRVYQANIHHGHHDFSMSRVAIKRLHSTDTKAFDREVEALKRFQGQDHSHIIDLLATFKHGNTYYLVFPWADSDLQAFWSKHPEPLHGPFPVNKNQAELTVKQMLGVAEALKAIHYCRLKKLSNENQDPSCSFKKGHHGDIKPENILVVDGQWKLADFGFSQVRRLEDTRSDDRPLGFSPTYRAPEHDVGVFNGQQADIWSLGCVMSVAATWITMGRKGIKAFREKRATKTAGRVDDSFFDVSKDQGEKTRVKLKSAVSHWMNRLHSASNASPFVHDLLDLVQHDMLDVDGAKRITSAQLVSKLEMMHSKCSEDPNYAQPAPRRKTSRSSPRTMGSSEAALQCYRSISVNMVRLPNQAQQSRTWPGPLEYYDAAPASGHYKPGYKCNRCLVRWETPAELIQHQRDDIQCLNRTDETDGIMDDLQWGACQSRLRGKSYAYKWNEIYKAIFGPIALCAIPSPYRDEQDSALDGFCNFLKSRMQHITSHRIQLEVQTCLNLVHEFQNSRSVTQSTASSEIPSLTDGYSNMTTASFGSQMIEEEAEVPLFEYDTANGGEPCWTQPKAVNDHLLRGTGGSTNERGEDMFAYIMSRRVMSTDPTDKVALVGLGAIGISFAALYLRHTKGCVSVFDTRADLEEHLSSVLPAYIDSDDPLLEISHLRESGRLVICSSLEEACRGATIVQEQGPENLDFKRSIWPQIEGFAPAGAHFWSSTSGIAASLQSQDMADKTRLLVVHPFNPPHILPLIEIVPSPDTRPDEVAFSKDFFERLGSGHRPVVIHKELPGFVGNRLAFAVFREACSLVEQDVVSAQDIDVIMEASLGPRWAVQGIFKSYNMGGGVAGIQAFLNNLSGTIQGIWDSSDPVSFEKAAAKPPQGAGEDGDENWEAKVVKQTIEAYGLPNTSQFRERDAALKKVLDVQNECRRNQSSE